MIEAIKLHNLRNGEFIQFINNFTSLVADNDPAALSVELQYDTLMLRKAELQSLFKNTTSNPITAEMEALDIQRDQAVNGIIKMIDAFGYHYNKSVVNAATVLQNNLKLYGASIAKENYQSETAIINNLTADWESKLELANAISDLNLGEWVKELKSLNQDFNQKFLARTQDYATASPDNQKSKRAEVMAAYYDLRKHLDAFSVVQKTAAYEKTMNELNALIEQYNSLLKGRATKKETSNGDNASLPSTSSGTKR